MKEYYCFYCNTLSSYRNKSTHDKSKKHLKNMENWDKKINKERKGYYFIKNTFIL